MAKVKIGVTTLGSEHGVENMVNGAQLAKSNLFDIVLIGPKVETDLEVVEVNDEKKCMQNGRIIRFRIY